MASPLSALIEIGVEELPVGVLDIFYAHAAENTRKIFSKQRLDFKAVQIDATPRRLSFFIEDLASKQKEDRNVILGPSHDKAYDDAGKSTAALEGFLKGHHAAIGDIQIKETPRGRYIALEKIQKGETTTKLLPRLVPEILASFPFPKMMRWEKTGFRFPRPIRWAVVLYGKSVLSFSLAGVKTGRVTYGHRFLAPRSLSIPKADWKDYRKRLRSAHVILDGEERKAVIQKGLQKKFHQKDFDADLVRETAHLVEEPFLMRGKFSGTFRDLPEEVLTTCMKKYQKIFVCRDGQGKLLNWFIAVLNGRRSGLTRIQHDYENVLVSRLRDAQYFYDEDTKEPLEKKASRLQEIVFLGRLGTMAERVHRLRELAGKFASLLRGVDFQEKFKQAAERAAFLSKVDLTTHMVYEFPELQGIIGARYASESGESEAVVAMIEKQYQPKSLTEDYTTIDISKHPYAWLFGIVDRIDLLVGAFGIRLEPTGSEDPYALRRAGGVLVKLVRALGLHFSIRKLIEESYVTYKIKPDLSCEEVTAKLLDFLKERVVFELRVKPGTKAYEILQGVMKSSFDNLADVFERHKILLGLSTEQPEAFLRTSKVVERTGNILKGVKESLTSVNRDLLKEEIEKKLYDLVQEEKNFFRQSLESRNYAAVTKRYGEKFFDNLNDFFDQVMVNVEDSQIRRNRQALMRDINTLYTTGVADLSLLTQVKE